MPFQHTLDFDYPDFLTYRQLPPLGDASLRGWIHLCTVVANESFGRPMYRVKDETGLEYLLAFYLNNDQPRKEEVMRFRPGHMLVLKNVMQRQFMDGQIGIRMEDEQLDDVKSLPCSIARFKELNTLLCQEGPNCAACQKPDPSKICSRCMTKYCSEACQMNDWKAGHKKDCKIIACLRELDTMFA